jgi:chemotaxis protein MotA
VVEFITDYLRMMVSGNLNAHEIESLMDSEIDTHHHEEHAAVAAIAAPGRRLAGVRYRGGGAGRGEHHGLGGPAPGRAGRHDRLGAGRYLPGHFAGLRFAEPLAGLLEQKVEEGGKELQCIKTTLLASMQGYNPAGGH